MIFIQGELPRGAQLDAPAGYTGYPGRTCRRTQDDDNIGEMVANLQRCADLCNEVPDCVSFEFNEIPDDFPSPQDDPLCYLHVSSCNHYGETTADRLNLCEPPSENCNVDPDWYFKHHSIIPTGYERVPANSGCHTTDTFSNIRTVQECANLCSADSGCKSFAYSCAGTRFTNGCNNENFEPNRCWLSSCDDIKDTNEQNPNSFTLNWFPKKATFQDGEIDCLVMTHDKAEVRKRSRAFFTFRVQ